MRPAQMGQHIRSIDGDEHGSTAAAAARSSKERVELREGGNKRTRVG